MAGCMMAGCVSMAIRNGTAECMTLEKPCYDEFGHCKFFKTKQQAKLDREAVSERAKESGAFEQDGTYRQRFVRAKRVEENGKAKTEIFPNIVEWLTWLYDRGTITLDHLERYKQAHPEG